MDVLSIYWNGVWTERQRDIRSKTEQKPIPAELAAFAKALKAPRRLGYSVLRSTWVAGRAD
jgi:hypothetical protein